MQPFFQIVWANETGNTLFHFPPLENYVPYFEKSTTKRSQKIDSARLKRFTRLSPHAGILSATLSNARGRAG